jgi:3-phosphoshikimate 1-carboxyvinyltransferase
VEVGVGAALSSIDGAALSSIGGGRCGVRAIEYDDGFEIVPGPVQPATIETYDDHRMAMSFSLLGLRSSGIEIADPGCVSKTFPGFFGVLESLRPEHP